MKIGIGRNLKALFSKKATEVTNNVAQKVKQDVPEMKVLKKDVFSLMDLPHEMHPDSPTFNWDKFYMF